MNQRYIILAAFLLTALTSVAQVNKGNWMLGGNATANFTSTEDNRKSSSITVTPSAGYFFIDKFVAGVMVDYDYSHSENDGGSTTYSSHTLGAGPFARYYFTFNTFAVFPHVDYTFSGGKSEQTGTYAPRTTDISGHKFSGGAGFAYFVRDNIGVEALVLYTNERTTNEPEHTEPIKYDNSAVTFRVGLQFYLSRK